MIFLLLFNKLNTTLGLSVVVDNRTADIFRRFFDVRCDERILHTMIVVKRS